jgi:DNA-binding IclR family transcriptional regulator
MKKRAKTNEPGSGPKGSAGTRIQSLHTAGKILEAFVGNAQPVRVNQLARELGMSRTRVSRQLLTLLELGFVERTQGSDGYQLGWKILQLGRVAASQHGLIERGIPRLNELTEITGETALLAAPANGDAVVCATSIAHLDITISLRPGSVLDLMQSPSARVILAFSPLGERERILSSRYSPRGRAYRSLKSRLGVIRERFFDAGEGGRKGIGGVAAPIFDADNQVCGAVTMLALVPHPQSAPWPKHETVTSVMDCAADISEELGSTVTYG